MVPTAAPGNCAIEYFFRRPLSKIARRPVVMGWATLGQKAAGQHAISASERRQTLQKRNYSTLARTHADDGPEPPPRIAPQPIIRPDNSLELQR